MTKPTSLDIAQLAQVSQATVSRALRDSPLVGWLLQTKALIMIIFANVLLDKDIITATTFTALLLMAVGSTMLTVPMVSPMLARLRGIVARSS